MRLPRATCPLCGREAALRRNGTLREHKAEPMARRMCEWSGRSPQDQPPPRDG